MDITGHTDIKHEKRKPLDGLQHINDDPAPLQPFPQPQNRQRRLRTHPLHADNSSNQTQQQGAWEAVPPPQIANQTPLRRLMVPVATSRNGNQPLSYVQGETQYTKTFLLERYPPLRYVYFAAGENVNKYTNIYTHSEVASIVHTIQHTEHVVKLTKIHFPFTKKRKKGKHKLPVHKTTLWRYTQRCN